VNNINSATI